MIHQNGLNHIQNSPIKEEVNLKYKIGDKVKVTGPLYNNENGEKIIQKKLIKKGTITKIIKDKKVVAPYEINKLGYAKEDELTLSVRLQ